MTVNVVKITWNFQKCCGQDFEVKDEQFCEKCNTLYIYEDELNYATIK
ncbi:MAG: hypothetical protein AAB456_03425 [Patescibacteria group bacterium]